MDLGIEERLEIRGQLDSPWLLVRLLVTASLLVKSCLTQTSFCFQTDFSEVFPWLSDSKLHLYISFLQETYLLLWVVWGHSTWMRKNLDLVCHRPGLGLCFSHWPAVIYLICMSFVSFLCRIWVITYLPHGLLLEWDQIMPEVHSAWCMELCICLRSGGYWWYHFFSQT